MNVHQYLIFIFLFSLGITLADLSTQASVTKSSTETQPVYHQPQDPITGYIPHVTYPYADVYGPVPGHDEYFIPSANHAFASPSKDYAMTANRNSEGLLHQAMRIFSKIGLFLASGIAILIVGSIFTTIVCSLTPLCTITFMGFDGINKETLRTFVNPERVANAAAFVENAVDKYQRLQRNLNNFL